MQGISPNCYPMSAAASRIVLALACANSPRFQPGNDCGGSGNRYGSASGVRTSRTTKGSVRAAGARETRRFTDGQGRSVVEHRTDDGRLFHEVTNKSGSKKVYQVHGPAATPKPKAAAAKPATGRVSDAADITPENIHQVYQHYKQEIENSDPKLSPARAGELAASRLRTAIGKRLDEINAKARDGTATPKEEAFYDKVHVDGWSYTRDLERSSGSRSLIADEDHPLSGRPLDAEPLPDKMAAFHAERAENQKRADEVSARLEQRRQERADKSKAFDDKERAARVESSRQNAVNQWFAKEQGAPWRGATAEQREASRREFVGQRLAQGKPVPPEVMQDYAPKPAAAGAKSSAAAAVAAKPAPAAPGEFARYRTPGGQDVRVGASGRIVAGPAGLLGKTPAEAGAVPEAEYHAGRAKAAAPAADPGARPGDKGFRPTPEQQRAADASAVPRPPGPSAAARAAARMGEKAADKPAAPESRAAAAVRESAGKAVAGTMGGMDKPAAQSGGLPKLTGQSDRQASYAADVRDKFHQSLGRMEQDARDDLKDDPGDTNARARLAAVDAGRKLAGAATDARTWLDSKSLSAGDIAHAAAGDFPPGAWDADSEVFNAWAAVAKAAGTMEQFKASGRTGGGGGYDGGMDKPGPASSETRYELADGTAVKLSVAPDPYDKSKAHVRVAKVDRQGRHSYTYHKAATAAAARAEYEDAKVKYRAALAAKGLKGEAETHR